MHKTQLLATNINLRPIKLITQLMLLSLNLSAAIAENKFEGPYEQMGIGFNKTNLNLSSTPLSLSSGQQIATITPSINDSSGLSGVITGGYLKSINDDFLLGVSLDVHPFKSSNNNYGLFFSAPASTSISGNLQNRGNYSISLTPAWVMTPNSLAYLKLGYVWGTVEKSYTVTPPTPAPVTNVNQSVTLRGSDVGLGFRSLISDQLYAFSEFNFVQKTDNNQSNSITLSSGRQANYSVSSGGSYYNLLVGVGYRF